MTFAALAASDFLTGGVSVGVTGGGAWFVLNQILKVQRLFMDRYAAEITSLASKNMTLQTHVERSDAQSFARGMAVVQLVAEVNDLRRRLGLPDRRIENRALLADLDLGHPNIAITNHQGDDPHA